MQILVTIVLSLYSLFSIEFSKKNGVSWLFMETNSVLCDSQYDHDFREKHSTEHALIDIVNQVHSHFDQGILSCGVFIV